ncbi:MAG: acyl-CoA dehydrogenase [Acidimicrobiia bacterium]|nr:acyl-CoA dehydrogenase [Acidimicrobiia bacterium]
MRLAWGQEQEAFREDLIAFLDEHAPSEALAWESASGTGSDDLRPAWAQAWQATLFDYGWMVPSYPPDLGGRNATPVQTLVYLEEMARRGIPRSLHFTSYGIAAPSLLEFGNDHQKALAPAAIRGDAVWCIGMSEPNAGSDLASLRTRAELDGEDFVVNGQKVWTSYAMVSDWCMCFVRTNVDVPKHRGISALLVDMRTPGIEVKPLRQITGSSEFAEVFFTDARVPAINLLGDLDDGWRITAGSLAHERAGIWIEGVARAERALDQLVSIAQATGASSDPAFRRNLAEVAERTSSLRTLGYKGCAGYSAGSGAPEHSYMKMATSELWQDLMELGMKFQGPYGAVVDPERAGTGHQWPLQYLAGFAATLAGGTSEIQRDVIARRVLGLPRANR